MERYKTKSELALQALRERIRSGALAPGQKLHVDELSRDLAMSRTPIREALRTLAADGLVEHRPHLGTTVSDRSASEIDDAYAIRLLLEPYAARLAIARMGSAELEELERLHRVFVESAMTAPAETLQENNGRWHWALYDAAASPALFETIMKFWGLTPWRSSWVGTGRIEAIVEEHERVMDAIRRRDTDETAERLAAHLEASRHAALVDDAVHETAAV